MEYLTIKEVASAVNKSYQNIYQRTKTSLKEYVIIKDGKTYLKNDVLNVFNLDINKEENKAGFKAENEGFLNDNLNDKLTPLHKANNEEDLNQLIKELRAEIKRKDDIIILKDEQLQKQTEEILQLSNKVVTLFENSQKLQLQTSFLLSDGNSANVETTDKGARAYEDNEEVKPKRKGFFSRFFK